MPVRAHPCALCLCLGYTHIRNGSCAKSLLAPGTLPGSVTACARDCRALAGCAFFAWDGVACNRYGKSGGCPIGGQGAGFDSYALTAVTSCTSKTACSAVNEYLNSSGASTTANDWVCVSKEQDCPATQYFDVTGMARGSNDWVCKDRLASCPASGRFSYHTPICKERFNATMNDGGGGAYACWCRPQCGPGEKYVYRELASTDRMHIHDQCVRCKLNW